MQDREWAIGNKEDLARAMRRNNLAARRDLFFMDALQPYYLGGITMEGMATEVGHIIYRLSDLVDVEDRKTFEIYPSPNGSIDLGPEYSCPWASLEDWRREWESNHPNIPDSSIAQVFIRDYVYQGSGQTG